MKHTISVVLFLHLLLPAFSQSHFRTVRSEPTAECDPLLLPKGTSGVWAMVTHITAISLNAKDAEDDLSWCTLSVLGKAGQGDKNFRLDEANYAALKGHKIFHALPLGDELRLFSMKQDLSGKSIQLLLTSFNADGQLGESRVIEQIALGKMDESLPTSIWAQHSPDFSKVVIVWPLDMGYAVYTANGERLVDMRFKDDSGITIRKAAVNNQGLPSALLAMDAKGLNKVSLGFAYHTSLESGAKVCDVTSPPGGFSDHGIYLESRASGNPLLVLLGLNGNGFAKGLSLTEVNLANEEVMRKVLDDKKVNWPLEVKGSAMFLADDGTIFIPSGKYDLNVLKIAPDFQVEACDWITRPYKDVINPSVYRVFDGRTIRGFVVCDEKAFKNLPKLKLGFSSMETSEPRSLVEVSRHGCGEQKIRTIAPNVDLGEFNLQFFKPSSAYTYCLNGFVVLPGQVIKGKEDEQVFIVWEE